MDENTTKKIKHILNTDYVPRTVADVTPEATYGLDGFIAMVKKVPPSKREGAKVYASGLYIASIGNVKLYNGFPIVQTIMDLHQCTGYNRVLGFIHEHVDFMPGYFESESTVKGPDGRLYSHVAIFGNLDNYTIKEDGSAEFPEKSIQVFCLRKVPKSKATASAMELGD
jgi:hypothetical protein